MVGQQIEREVGCGQDFRQLIFTDLLPVLNPDMNILTALLTGEKIALSLNY